jgi:hypothetical protein
MYAAALSASNSDALAGSDPHGFAPSQWEDRQRPEASSELRLMAAVMIDALRDFRQAGEARGTRARQLGRLARRWILSRDRSWPYSFESICAVFDVDADDLRRTLLREYELGAQQRHPRRRRNLVLGAAAGPTTISRHSRAAKAHVADVEVRASAVA